MVVSLAGRFNGVRFQGDFCAEDVSGAKEVRLGVDGGDPPSGGLRLAGGDLAGEVGWAALGFPILPMYSSLTD